MTKTRNERLFLGISLCVAGVLRMGWPGLTEFKADEARLYSLALDMAEGLYFPLRGIGSSVGLPNFPISVWLYSIPTFLWKHPYSATLFTGLLSTISVFVCWWVVKRYWGSQAASAATFMYAVSPWAVIYSRKIWAQNLLPLFVLGWAATGLFTFLEGRRRAVACHVFCLAIVIQIHLSGIALLPLTIIGLLIYRRRVDWRWLAAGLLAAVIMAAPLAIHLANEASYTVPELVEKATGTATFSFNSMLFTWMLSSGQDIHALAGSSAFQDYLQLVPDVTWVQWLWGFFIVAGCWHMTVGNKSPIVPLETKSNSRMAGLITISWLIAPMLFFLWQPTKVFPHYFIITFPAQYIAGGIGLTALLQHTHTRALLVPGWGAFLLSGALQVYVLAGLLHFVTQQATPGGVGTPLAMQLTAVEKAKSLVEQGLAQEILLVGDGDDPEIHEFPAVYGSLLRSVDHRYVNGNTSALRPIRSTAVILQPGDFSAKSTYELWASKIEGVPMRNGEGAITLFYLQQHATDLSPAVPFPTPRRLANGVTLLGFTPLPGDDLRWEIYWQIERAVATNYHFFNHLVDASSERIGQTDAAALSSSQWRAGDQLVSFFSATLTADGHPETLRVGMYNYPDVENVPLLDAMGNPIGEWVKLRWDSSYDMRNQYD